MAENNTATLDSLLVSLGLDLDKKSFQAATDAINDVKNKSLQLLAAAGVGIGFDAWTRGVAKYTTEVETLSYATKTATRDVEALRHAFKAQGMAAGEADAILRRMADVQRNIQLGILPAFPGSDVLMGKTPVQMLQALSQMLPAMDEQMQIRALQEMGIMPGSSVAKMLLEGGEAFQKRMGESRSRVTGISPDLSDDVAEFNKQMADLQTNFTELSKSMGEKLLPPLNKLLEITNDFISANPGLVEASVAIAMILGTLKGYAALKWLFTSKAPSTGTAGAAGAGAAGAAGKGWLRKAGLYGLAASLLYDPIETGMEKALGGSEFAINAKNMGIFLASDGTIFFKKDEYERYQSQLVGNEPFFHAGNEGIFKSRRSRQAAPSNDVPRVAQSMHRAQAPLMPEFIKAAQKYGVPVDILLGLAKQESSFNPNAVGELTKWGHAKGIMQYLPGTAASLGINPLDPVQAIDAAAKQLRERLNKGESIEEAIAHHHSGPNRKLWGPKTEDYVRKVTEHATGFQGMDDVVSAAMGSYNSPSQILPSSDYSASSQTFHQTNNVTIESTGDTEEDNRLFKLYSRNAADAFTSDTY